MSSKFWQSRRNVLRGLGVGLALPWLEFAAPRRVNAQTQSPIKRYLCCYFPNGVARAFWRPTGAGAGDNWQLSSLLEPLLPYKQYLQVIEGIGQEELFNLGVNPNPSHSMYCAGAFGCTVMHESLPILGGPTVDQLIANQIGANTPFKSLQIGCSTMNSSPDSRHPSMTRSISWSATDQPLYKEVNPQTVFDSLVAQLAPGGAADPANVALAELRKQRQLSVLDFVLDEAQAIHGKLSVGDRRRLDQFLTSAREIEMRTQLQGTAMTEPGKTYVRPTLSASYNERNPGEPITTTDPQGYNRNDHAEVMNDLITMAFETDLTNVITHMMDDARSDYHYQFLKQREFSNGTSTEIDAPLQTLLQGDLLGYHGLSHDGDNNFGFATVNHWFVTKLASLLQRLSQTPETDGSQSSVLDNTFILFMSAIQGSSHELIRLPVVFAGGQNVFKTNYFNDFPSQVRLADVHLTIMQSGFGVDIDQFGYSQGIVPELLI